MMAQPLQPINSILGDQSFMAKYGRLPDNSTPDDMRIAAHLEYVEGLLRTNAPGNLSEAQIAKRNEVIELLHEYRLAGLFPINYDMPFRAPCFIDRDNTICAVGYLVEQTAGREIAEQINSEFQYARVFDMHSDVVADWATKSGLTLTECAMIQPEYGPSESPAYYASQRGESFSEFIASRLTLKGVDSVNVTCVIDTSGKVNWIRVIGNQPLAGQVDAAIKEAKFHPGQLHGWMIRGPGWPNLIEWTASFQIVFNHPSDSIFVPTVIDYRAESRGTDAQPGEYSRIKLVISPDSTMLNGYRQILGGSVIVIEERKMMNVSFYAQAEFLVSRDTGSEQFDVRIESPHYSSLIVKGIPAQDAQIEFVLSYIGRVSTMPYQCPMNLTRLGVWTQGGSPDHSY
jgi:hypothetical protein